MSFFLYKSRSSLINSFITVGYILEFLRSVFSSSRSLALLGFGRFPLCGHAIRVFARHHDKLIYETTSTSILSLLIGCFYLFSCVSLIPTSEQPTLNKLSAIQMVDKGITKPSKRLPASDYYREESWGEERVYCKREYDGSFVPAFVSNQKSIGTAYRELEECQKAISNSRRSGLVCSRETNFGTPTYVPYILDDEILLYLKNPVISPYYSTYSLETCQKEVETATRQFICLHGQYASQAALFDWQNRRFLDANYGDEKQCFDRLPKRKRRDHEDRRDNRDVLCTITYDNSVQNFVLTYRNGSKADTKTILFDLRSDGDFSKSIEKNLERINQIGCQRFEQAANKCEASYYQVDGKARPWIKITLQDGAALNGSFNNDEDATDCPVYGAYAGGGMACTNCKVCSQKETQNASEKAKTFLTQLPFCP